MSRPLGRQPSWTGRRDAVRPLLGVHSHMLKLITKTQAAWANRDRGATAVEYGLIVALIAAIIVGVVATLGTDIAAAFQTVVDEI